jgi:NinB protein
MTKQIFCLAHAQARQNAAQAVMQAPDGWFVTLQDRTRTIEQNARYWSRGILSQIAEKAVVGGRRFSAEAWHEQFKRQFIGIEELPSGQVIGKSSTKLGVKAFSEFVDQVEAYAVTDLGVVFEDEKALA